MRHGLYVAVAALILANAAAAQGLREDDVLMTADEVRSRIAGKAVLFHDGSEARYSATGEYTYRYAPQDPAFGGTFTATEDSRICVTFTNGFSRCDTYVLNGDRLVLITGQGLRFPVKTLTDLD